MRIRRAVLEIEKKLIVQGTKTHAVRNVGLDEEKAEMLCERRARAAELGLAAGVPPKPDDFVLRKGPVSSEPLPPTAWGRCGTGCAMSSA